MTENNAENRRSFLKSVGSGVAAVSVVSGTTFAKKDKAVTAEEVGIQAEYISYMEEGDVESAIELLKANDVEYNHTHKSRAESSSDGISTQDYYTKSSSSIDFATGDWAPGKKVMSMSWDLRNVASDIDGPAPQDLATLAYEEDVFGYVDDSIRHTGSVTTDNGTAENLTSIESKPVSGDPANAFVVSFDDNWIIHESAHAQGYMQIVVRKQKSTTGRLAGKYAHSWSASNVAGFGLNQINVSLLGFISYSDPFGADRWTLGGDGEA